MNILAKLDQKNLVAAILVGTLVLGGCSPSLQDIEDQVAEDAVKQYNIVKSSGATAVDLCVQAGLVAAAYLQAHNESQYAIWNARELVHCNKARLGT